MPLALQCDRGPAIARDQVPSYESSRPRSSRRHGYPSNSKHVANRHRFAIVFSPCLIPGQLPRRCQRRQHWPPIISYSSWRSPNCHQTPRCCRSEGEDCQCSTYQHQIGWCRRLQQHDAEYVDIVPDAVLKTLDRLVKTNGWDFVGLYTDESPGLKVDPVIVLVLSLVFIFSVVALHGMCIVLAFNVEPPD